MTKSASKSAAAYVPKWAPISTLAGTATLTAWLLALPNGNKDPKARPDQLDYIWQPLPDSVDRALGLLGGAILLVTAVVLARRMNKKQLQGRALSKLGWFAASGILLGLNWVSVTWGGRDANIGGGIAMIFGFPIAGVVALIGVLGYLQARNRANQEQSLVASTTVP